MLDIQQILQNRILASESNETLKAQMKLDASEYHKKYLHAIQCFQTRINFDQSKNNKPPYPYMAVYKKLEHIKEIDDLRWFYKECLKYSHKKGKNFSILFFGALKTKNRKF